MCVHTAPDDSSDDQLWQFEGGLRNFTKFSSFRELSSVTFPAPLDAGVAGLSRDPGSKYGTVSMDIDRDGEFFSVVGITKKILF